MADAPLPGYSAQQIRDAEAPLLAEGVPLMRRAADGLAEYIQRMLPPGDAPILLLVGPGNNGGDALFAGERLARHGREVIIVPTSARIHSAGLAAAIAAGARLQAEDRRTPHDVAAFAQTSAVVVDGILGTGTSTSPALRGAARDLVVAVRPIVMTGGGPRVVAVDLPSGIHPDDGSVPDPTAVLPAELTVTFGACKAGLLREPAASLAGRIEVVDIGLGPHLEGVAPLIVQR